MSDGEKKSKFISKKTLFIIIAVIILLIAVFASIYFFIQYQKSQGLLSNPTAAAKQEAKALIEKVGKLIELPQKEDPTIATVSDVNKLKDQPFFAKAILGDKVLIYNQARKAILYRPGTNKIIEVAPVNVDYSSQNQNQSNVQGKITGSPTPTIKLALVGAAIYNGTKVNGLASTVEKQIKDKIQNIEVVIKSNAKNDYTKTLVVDVSGKNSAIVKQIAEILSGEVGTLPKNEVAPPSTADIVIFLGE